MTEYKVFWVQHKEKYWHCVVFAKDKIYAKKKAIKRMLKIDKVKSSAKDWIVEEFTPNTYGGCVSFSD